MKIMGYLSTYDLLRIVAQVSKKFQEISRDPFLIKSIKLRPQLEDLTEEEEEKLCGDFLDVVRRSEKLKFLSLNFIGWDERKFLAMFPSIKRIDSLEEFWLKFDSMNGFEWNWNSWIWSERLRILGSNLKILKIDFDQYPFHVDDIGMVLEFNDLTFENLKILHLKFNKNYRRALHHSWAPTPESMQQMIFSFISSITKKFPKLESLRLSLWLEPEGIEEWVVRNTLSYKFYNGVSQLALEKKIEIEIVDLYKK